VLSFDFKNELDMLKYMSITDVNSHIHNKNKNNSKKLMTPVQNKLWKENIQIIDNSENIDINNLKSENPFYDLVKHILPEKKFMVELSNIFADDFSSYSAGNVNFF
jgi:hypothetical protein